MIIEENLEGWNNNPVKSKEVVYPQSKDDKAPKNYFLGIFCGSRGSGKMIAGSRRWILYC